MRLTDEQINKFQALWEKRFNQPISKEEALAKGIQLVNLIGLICKQKPKTIN